MLIKNVKAIRSGFLFVLLSLLTILSSFLPERKANEFTFKKGTNISHWLSQSNRRGEERKNFFTEKDVQYLAGLGFDHLRIPVDEEQLWKEDGQQDAEAFSLLTDAIDWCRKYKLDAVVDLHILRSHHFNEKEKPLWTKPEAQERFFQCWRDLS
ncbi:MAG: cellulase family glycosylhydrolase, partial [Chitinophagaceae bacterium]